MTPKIPVHTIPSLHPFFLSRAGDESKDESADIKQKRKNRRPERGGGSEVGR